MAMVATTHSAMTKQPVRCLLWGSYDPGKPRVRIMRQALLDSDAIELTETPIRIWLDISDKSQMRFTDWLRVVIRSFYLYPMALWHLARAPKPDCLLIGYMGVLDLLLAWPVARLRGIPLILDLFISLYDTTVYDRKLLSRYHPAALLIYALEWLAFRGADFVVMDTKAHADYVSRLYRLPAHRCEVAWVGAEDLFCPSEPIACQNDASLHLLFYGSFIPLHGVETIIDAAYHAQEQGLPMRWTIIGAGQLSDKIDRQLASAPTTNITRLQHVAYEELPAFIATADICLGIFGSSAKAASVIPNKVYQAMACGRPVITRHSDAYQELPEHAQQMICQIPPEDPQALIEAILAYRKNSVSGASVTMKADIQRQWESIIVKALQQ